MFRDFLRFLPLWAAQQVLTHCLLLSPLPFHTSYFGQEPSEIFLWLVTDRIPSHVGRLALQFPEWLHSRTWDPLRFHPSRQLKWQAVLYVKFPAPCMQSMEPFSGDFSGSHCTTEIKKKKWLIHNGWYIPIFDPTVCTSKCTLYVQNHLNVGWRGFRKPWAGILKTGHIRAESIRDSTYTSLEQVRITYSSFSWQEGISCQELTSTEAMILRCALNQCWIFIELNLYSQG